MISNGTVHVAKPQSQASSEWEAAGQHCYGTGRAAYFSTVPANGRKNTGVRYAAEPRSRCHVWNNVLLQTTYIYIPIYIGVLCSARERTDHIIGQFPGTPGTIRRDWFPETKHQNSQRKCPCSPTTSTLKGT